LLFRELKTQYDLDEFDTSSRDVVKILLYAALLSLLVSRELLELVTEQAGDGSCFRRSAGRRPSGRTPFILHELGEYLGFSPPLLERLIERTEDSPATTDTRDGSLPLLRNRGECS